MNAEVRLGNVCLFSLNYNEMNYHMANQFALAADAISVVAHYLYLASWRIRISKAGIFVLEETGTLAFD